MPKVGLKEFPYTPEGEGEAKIYAAQTDQPLSKDPYGYGTERGMQEGGMHSQEEALIKSVFEKGETEHSVGKFDGKGQKDHAAVWGKFANPEHPLSDKGFMAFMQADLDTKKDLLRMFSKGSDDTLLGSEEWMRISGQEGMQRGGPVKDQFGYGSYQEGGNVKPGINTEQLDDPRREGFSSKQKIDDLAQRYTQEYLEAGVDQDKAYWLSLIDIGFDPETKNVISEDPELQKMYQGLFKSTNINYLDVTHHRQSRSRLGLDSPHMGEADWRGKQEGGPVGKFGY